MIAVFKAGLSDAFEGATIQYNNTNYTSPVILILQAGEIMNVSAINVGFTTENKLVTVHDASGSAAQQITFIMSDTLVSIFSKKNVMVKWSIIQ